MLPYFFVGFVFAAFSSMWRMVSSPPPSALPMVKAGFRFSRSVCGYLW